jgi:predicted GNAT family acetyltransferase
VGTLAYSDREGKLYLIHTEVPKQLEGHGYAGALAKTALEYAKEQGLEVVPFCPFVRAYLQRHPEYASLVR